MIVKSILDTDLYKFTTSYAYMKLFPHAIGTFEFFDRDNTEYTEEFVQQLWIEISNFCSLKLTHDEQDYMTTHCRFIPPMYWEWLSGIRLSAGKVKIWLDEDKHLHIKATDYLYRVTLYEVPILAIVSELRNRMLSHTINMTDVLIRLEPKIVLSNQNQMFFSEFGTRRRYSYNVQEAIVKSLKDGATYCTGTSNCYLAMKYDMPMMGTHPHEWFMFHGAMYGYKQANYMALEDWVSVYDGDLGIALSDTYTSAVFFKNLSRMTLKEIVTLPAEAKFTHAIAGTLYYRITTDDVVVEFPIDMNDKDDVGTTTFVASYKPITLMRYIRKAIENGTLIKVDKSKLK